MKTWSPSSWQTKTTTQAVHYPDPHKVNEVMQVLAALPPLVNSLEVIKLKQALTEVIQGEAFLLQGGDCAESFTSCREDSITNKLKILLQMSLILIQGMHKPVIQVGRIAGQYAKPRSDAIETREGMSFPSYRGDLINKPGFTLKDRTPDPSLMLEGYHYAARTLNHIRTLLKSNNLNQTDFYTSHEALNLYYEETLTRKAADGNFYNLSTHFPWIGMRTTQLDGAHVEFFRGISNPIAVKIGPDATPDFVLDLIETLNPKNEVGRLTLIVRLGVDIVGNQLPRLIEVIKHNKKSILWSSDPMHGNTHKTESGIRTRRFDDILSELTQSFRIHKELNSHLGGVHFELTGENVTECIGGAQGLSESDLHMAYETLLDPRLNYEQSLEMARLIVKQE